MSTTSKKKSKPIVTEAIQQTLAKEKLAERESADLGAKLDHHNSDILGQQRNRLAHPHDPGS